MHLTWTSNGELRLTTLWTYSIIKMFQRDLPRWTLLVYVLPSNLWFKTHLNRQYNCWSLRCNWSIADRRCSNYTIILDLTTGLRGLDKDNCWTGRETFKFCDLVRLILEIWRYVKLHSVPPQTFYSSMWFVNRQIVCLQPSLVAFTRRQMIKFVAVCMQQKTNMATIFTNSIISNAVLRYKLNIQSWFEIIMSSYHKAIRMHHTLTDNDVTLVGKIDQYQTTRYREPCT